MAKYSYKFKKQVVDAYLRGEGGYTFLADKYGVTNRRQVLNWVHNYQRFGDSGLLRSRKNNDYSFEFKLAIVESYLSGEASCRELALENGINNTALVNKLEQAITVTADCPYRRTFHSDQGWAYQMKTYSHRLKEERIFQSMSRKGNCHDNSVMENFFGLLKQEISLKNYR